MINVIMPTYNSEKTIAQSLHSLAMQNHPRKFILTVVDDGSTDNTLEIVNDFKKYIPIRIIEMPENKGVGFARQIGLESTECEFVCFLDSDDKFFPYTINLYNREVRTTDHADILICDFISEQKGREVLIKGKQAITWLHGKIYRVSYLNKYQIKFPPLRYNEDSGFSTMAFELSNNKAYIPEIVYFWTENFNSITRSDGEFNLKSLPNFVNSIKFAFKHIDNYKDIYEIPSFYGQFNNMYHYYSEALYHEFSWVEEVEVELKKYFEEFWVENRIRPNMLVDAFSRPAPKFVDYLPPLSQLEFVNKMSNNSYTAQDFRVDKEKK